MPNGCISCSGLHIKITEPLHRMGLLRFATARNGELFFTGSVASQSFEQRLYDSANGMHPHPINAPLRNGI
jgi:hypothetical protein